MMYLKLLYKQEYDLDGKRCHICGTKPWKSTARYCEQCGYRLK